MSGNAIKAFVTIGTTVKGSKLITLGVATQTSHWTRPVSVITEDMKSGFKAAVDGDSKELPARADKVVMRGPKEERVTIKAAPIKQLNNEIQLLGRFHNSPYIRQLVDEIDEPAAAVLQYMDDNALNLLKRKQLPKHEAKRAAKAVFSALEEIHNEDIVHTDVKPDNIFVRYSQTGNQYRLGDLGDSAPSTVLSNNGDHAIGAEVFCAPEVALGIPWTFKADIWAAGATIITLLTGNYVFLPSDAPPPGDPRLCMGILQMQNDYYGPLSREAYHGLADESLLPLLQQFEAMHLPFSLASASRNIDDDDVEFFRHVMKPDPRSRPTAREVLQHKWFEISEK